SRLFLCRPAPVQNARRDRWALAGRPAPGHGPPRHNCRTYKLALLPPPVSSTQLVFVAAPPPAAPGRPPVPAPGFCPAALSVFALRLVECHCLPGTFAEQLDSSSKLLPGCP